MQDLKVTIIQSDLHWQSVDANLAMFEEKIWQINDQSDLIVLPEMFNTGFTMEAEKFAEPMNSKTFRWMKQQAAQTGAVVTGSFIVQEKGNYFNRLIWMQPDGNYNHYDKRHLFRMSGEHHHYTAGTTRIIQKIGGWKICPMICYDLRFPVWSRRQETEEMQYDLLLFVANWPAVRVNAWDILLKARAVENLSYVIGVNRVGNDGNEIPYNGHSCVIDPKGKELYFNHDEESIDTISLDYEMLDSFRKKFPAYLDSDDFSIEI
ncbi:amidohydrolase [Fulvivirgaceae bacterium BMA10]|uniref:Amidohydrolase n=1 Tax=Splendidivirga corallicola TaxID=3051826 RepID=A0ABT8KNQ0_9BACT|nr:amidohydrolase [Fulvivirgaceae bacterium BMA10]